MFMQALTYLSTLLWTILLICGWTAVLAAANSRQVALPSFPTDDAMVALK